MKKAIVTVIGNDKVGIIAGVSRTLADSGVNILDISQTVLQEYFTMVMLVDVDNALPFSEIKRNLAELGGELGMSIRIQHEELFNSMHKV